jgi:hypothetical protein
MLGTITPPGKLPLYVGVLTTVALAVSSAVLLLLAPALERVGFSLLFMTVLTCGVGSLLLNVFVLKRLLHKSK